MHTIINRSHLASSHTPRVRNGTVVLGFVSAFAAMAASASYKIVPVEHGGAIEGYVAMAGKISEAPPIKITKNQEYCGDYVSDPTYIVGHAGGLANVVVYLKDVTTGKGPDTSPPSSLTAEHCMLNPRAQGSMVGQPLSISSRDPIFHNSHPVWAETNSTIFNVALPFAGVTMRKSLPNAAGLIKVKSDAQEWMHAWIVELEHPYFATTDQDGHFSIRDIPPGTYTLVAWHEAAGEKSESVVVVPGKTVKQKIVLAAQ